VETLLRSLCLHRMWALYKRLSGQYQWKGSKTQRHHSQSQNPSPCLRKRFTSKEEPKGPKRTRRTPSHGGPGGERRRTLGLHTCHACVEVCPVEIEHVERMINLRRHLVMREARFPSEIKSLFRNLEIYGDTHGRGQSFRYRLGGSDCLSKEPRKIPILISSFGRGARSIS